MSGYILNFTVYTMAMTGLICFAVFVYKKFTDGSMGGKKTQFLSVEDSMSLSPRKTLHIVRAGNEKFLIASDIENTTLIAKLGSGEDKIPANIEKLVKTSTEKENNFSDIIIDDSVPYEIAQKLSDYDTGSGKIKLEPIREKNPNSRRKKRGLDNRAGNAEYTPRRKSPSTVREFSYDYEMPRANKNTYIKSMAMKINEL